MFTEVIARVVVGKVRFCRGVTGYDNDTLSISKKRGTKPQSDNVILLRQVKL
jgi:hypothetical protein